MLLTSKTIVQIQSKLEAIKACCVILSKETLIASVRVMNHVHSAIFLHRYIVSVDNKFRKTLKALAVDFHRNVMQFTEDHVNKRFQAYRFKNRIPARFEYIYCTLLISIISFNLGHVSIPKRRIFSPLFLFCAYDSSVLQSFKIFTHVLPNCSHSTLR